MNCQEIDSLMTRIPRCEATSQGVRLMTHCLYPSADPVWVYVDRKINGFRVSDKGGALRSALVHGCKGQGNFDSVCKRYAVDYREGEFVAEPESADWLWAAVLAISNASSEAARDALETAMGKTEKGLNAGIFDALKSIVPESRIARKYDYRGKSGHIWQVDFAVVGTKTVLIKSVVQNGNSINSNYATFGDVGDAGFVEKFSVYDRDLQPDAFALLRQVATVVPVNSVANAAVPYTRMLMQ